MLQIERQRAHQNEADGDRLGSEADPVILIVFGTFRWPVYSRGQLAMAKSKKSSRFSACISQG